MSPTITRSLLALAGSLLLSTPALAQSPTITAAPVAPTVPVALERRQATTSTCNFDLAEVVVPYDQIPYQVDPCTDGRGPQVGYNLCNSTTENQESLCQTTYLNDLSDFCLWAPPTPNTNISDSEAYEVAWCTKKGHGTRLIPDGALTGVQLLRTPNYIQLVGFINQDYLNMPADDQGGELDGRGQDNRGNPMGGLTYSNAYNGSNTTYTQLFNWQWFMGSNMFCAKICPGAAYDPTSYAFCFNEDDEIGCDYNMPNAAQNGTFESCDADNALPVGQYVIGNTTSTWTQGWTGFASIPYTPIPPSSSNCVTYQSADLYTDLAGIMPSNVPSNPPSVTAGGSGAQATGGSGASGSRSGAASGPSQTGSSGTGKNGAGAVGVPMAGLSLLAILAGVLVLA